MSRKKKHFDLNYIGVQEQEDGTAILYHKFGDKSIIFSIQNPITRFSGDKHAYFDHHHAYTTILKLLGDEYTLQKHDIFSRQTYCPNPDGDFLNQHYEDHFEGRTYRKVTTYLTITKHPSKGFFQYRERELASYKSKIEKINNLLAKWEMKPKKLNEQEVDVFVKRYLAMNFSDKNFSLRNFKVTNDEIEYSKDVLKVMSLVDVDEVNFPEAIHPYNNMPLGRPFPVDIVSFLYNIPGCQTIIFNQVIEIPNQRKELFKLEAKRKRHTSVPNAANLLCVTDIDNVITHINRHKEQLVYCHYDLLFFGDPNEVTNATNYVEGQFAYLGIIKSNNAYNQKELFSASFPGHTPDLKDYDKFFTTSSPALCLMYKERSNISEEGDFKFLVTNREGLPINIDTSEQPMQSGRISNRNKFILGPSGTGKSYLVNSLVNDYLRQDTDIVMVDTGHSYAGLCSYHKGRYVTYEESSPISINPFFIQGQEYNEEKRQYLKTLVGILWKGPKGSLSQVEDSVLAELIVDYYKAVFAKEITSASFNTFYEFSIKHISTICKKGKIEVDVNDYAFILKKFYKGGAYETLLNKDMDKTLFNEKFVVFEIDNVKDNETLFPVITLAIMDLFLQKMRLKDNRKVLIIEEAWKALMSPIMAVYAQFVFKTARKFWGEAVCVTQELDDIIGNPIVKNSIINNSDTIFLLDQSKFRDNFNQIADLLSLNEIEQNKIFTINQLDNKDNRGQFREFYAKRGDRGEVFGIEKSLAEHLTFTTEKKEKQTIGDYRKIYGDHSEAITNLIKDLKESGLTLTAFCDKYNSEMRQKMEAV